MNSKPHTIPCGIATCTFSDKLSQNTSINIEPWLPVNKTQSNIVKPPKSDHPKGKDLFLCSWSGRLWEIPTEAILLENLNRLLLRWHMGDWTSQQKQLHVQWDMSVRVFYLQTEQPGLNKHKTVEKDVIIIMSRMWVKHRNNIEPKTSQTPGGCSINWATNERLTESSFILFYSISVDSYFCFSFFLIYFFSFLCGLFSTPFD